MALVNEHFLKLSNNYLFADIAKKVNAYKVSKPNQKVISLGIGDVTRPLCPAVINAMHKAVDEMASKATFRGYGPERGYDFLREAIIKHDYAPRGIRLDANEIFINDGAKSDTGNIQEIVRWDNSIGVTDPIYPVYIDSNVMIGRAGVRDDSGKWSNVTYFPCTAENNFIPQLPDHRVDMIYLCYPNNPTGTVLPKEELRKWVNYAKTAGFTGVRCGYTVIPKELTAITLDGKTRVDLNHIWDRRQSTKFNGTSYISQRAAEAIYTPEGKQQVRETIDYYMQNAKIMYDTLSKLGYKVYGGKNAPYLWVKTPDNIPSWKFFDKMLYSVGVVCTPGVGFGPSGEGYFRLTAFGNREDVVEAMSRIARL